MWVFLVPILFPKVTTVVFSVPSKIFFIPSLNMYAYTQFSFVYKNKILLYVLYCSLFFNLIFCDQKLKMSPLEHRFLIFNVTVNKAFIVVVSAWIYCSVVLNYL